jgi:hypothetical protein
MKCRGRCRSWKIGRLNLKRQRAPGLQRRKQRSSFSAHGEGITRARPSGELLERLASSTRWQPSSENSACDGDGSMPQGLSLSTTHRIRFARLDQFVGWRALCSRGCVYTLPCFCATCSFEAFSISAVEPVDHDINHGPVDPWARESSSICASAQTTSKPDSSLSSRSAPSIQLRFPLHHGLSVDCAGQSGFGVHGPSMTTSTGRGERNLLSPWKRAITSVLTLETLKRLLAMRGSAQFRKGVSQTSVLHNWFHSLTSCSRRRRLVSAGHSARAQPSLVHTSAVCF